MVDLAVLHLVIHPCHLHDPKPLPPHTLSHGQVVHYVLVCTVHYIRGVNVPVNYDMFFLCCAPEPHSDHLWAQLDSMISGFSFVATVKREPA